MRKKLRNLACILLSAVLLAGCAPRAAKRTIFAMDTVMTLTIYGKGAEDNAQAAVERINQLERLLSVTREDSEVWRLNHAQGERVHISPETNALFRAAQELGEATGGALDVTLYPVLKAWGFTTGEYRVPDGAELAELLGRVDYRAIQVEPDETGPADVTLPVGVEVDFGALAKGYAGELCAGMLRGAGVESALLELGGNVQTVGSKPDGTPWRVAVQDPAGESGESLGTVRLVDMAAVTSGNYQRFFEENGVRYGHILDPQTGASVENDLLSVTVVGASGTMCDALSTALFVMGKEDALAFWKGHRDWGFDLILVDDAGGVTVTAGLKEGFALNEGSGYALRIVEE